MTRAPGEESRADPTPLAVFAYRRPRHLDALLEGLAACDDFRQCRVFVFSDGWRDETDRAHVLETRSVARRWITDHGGELIERAGHLGVARSVVSGVSELCGRFGEVLVFEDDLLVRRETLRFLREGLARYRDSPSVFQVSAFAYAGCLPHGSRACFLPLVTSWGWGTWKRAWNAFAWDAPGWRESLADRVVRRRFDVDGTSPFSDLLKDRFLGRNDSWAVLWYWAVFSRQGMTLFPRQSLVWNAGFDGSGSHCRDEPPPGVASREEVLEAPPIGEFEFPGEMVVDTRAYENLVRCLRHEGHRRAPPWSTRLTHRLRRLIEWR